MPRSCRGGTVESDRAIARSVGLLLPTFAKLDIAQRTINSLGRISREEEVTDVDEHGIPLKPSDISKILDEDGWLNDEMINRAAHFMNKEHPLQQPDGEEISWGTWKAEVLETYWFKKIEDGTTPDGWTASWMDNSGMTRGQQPQLNSVMIPYNHRNHWILVVVFPLRHKIAILDSLAKGTAAGIDERTAVYKHVYRWLRTHMEDDFDEQQWTRARLQCPQQENSDDCGIHLVLNAWFISNGIWPMAHNDLTPRDRRLFVAWMVDKGTKECPVGICVEAMSLPLSRQQEVVLVQREQETPGSGTAQSAKSGFMTQMQYEPSQHKTISDSAATGTPAKASGRRYIPASRGSQATTSTAGLLSHHSRDQTEQAKTLRQGQLISGPSIPQEQGPNSRSSQTGAEVERAVSKHSPALDNAPIRALYDAVHNLLNQGFPPEVVREGFDQSIVSYFHHFKQDQSVEQCTPELIAEIVKQHANLKKQSAALVPNIRGSQHRSKSPSQDSACGILLDMADTSSKAILPNGEDLSEQVAASPFTDEGIDMPKLPPKLKSLKLGDLHQRTIKDEQAFLAVFREYALESITVGEYVIDLLKLARATVKDVNRTLAQRNSHQSRKEKPDTMTEKEIWQILFTIIANIFVFGLEPLCDTVKAMEEQSSRYDDAAAADISADSNERARRNGGKSNNGVVGHISQDILFKIVDKEALGKLAGTVRFVEARENKSQAQLNRVYLYYVKLQMVRQYDAMTEKWKEDEERIQEILESEGYKRRKGERWPTTLILSYIHQQCTPSRERDNTNIVALLSSEHTKKISELISDSRTVCSYVDAFGEGVLLMLRGNAKVHLKGKGGNKWTPYPQHSRIRDVALSLRKVDKEDHRGKLHKLFINLKKRVFKPALKLRKSGSTGSLVFQSPKKLRVEEEEVGKRIAYILCRFRKKTDTRSDIFTTQTGQHRLKRKMLHSSVEEASEGVQGPRKRHRFESIEDQESRRDGPDIGNVSGQDLSLDLIDFPEHSESEPEPEWEPHSESESDPEWEPRSESESE